MCKKQRRYLPHLDRLIHKSFIELVPTHHSTFILSIYKSRLNQT